MYNKQNNALRLYKRRSLSKFSGGTQSTTEFAEQYALPALIKAKL